MERHERFGGIVVAMSLMVVACAGDPADEANTDTIQPIGSTESAAESEAESSDSATMPEEVTDPAPVEEPEPEPEGEDVTDEPDPAVDVTVIPDEITPEYVEAVLVELEQLYIDAYIGFYEAGEPTLAAMDAMGSAFTVRQVEARMGEFAELHDEGYPGFQAGPDATARVHMVQEIHDQAGDCIYVETTLDLTGVLLDDPPLEAMPFS